MYISFELDGRKRRVQGMVDRFDKLRYAIRADQLPPNQISISLKRTDVLFIDSHPNSHLLRILVPRVHTLSLEKKRQHGKAHTDRECSSEQPAEPRSEIALWRADRHYRCQR